MVLLGLLQAATEGIERLVAAQFGRTQPRIEHEVGEFAVLLEAPQDCPHFSDHEFEHRYLLVEEAQDLLLQGVAGNEVKNENLALLADAIDPSDALLDGHRIPRHVEIDEGVAKLDIASFTARFGTEKHRHPVAKLGNGGVLLGTAQAALEACEGEALPSQQVGEMNERLAVMDEDQLLFVRVPPQQLEQGRLLAAVAGRCPTLRQRVPTRLIGAAASQALYGSGCGGRRRSRGAEQMMQHEPVSA